MSCQVLNHHTDIVIITIGMIVTHLLLVFIYYYSKKTVIFDIGKLLLAFYINFIFDLIATLLNEVDEQCYNLFILNLSNLLVLVIHIIVIKMCNYIFRKKNFYFLISGNYSFNAAKINLEYILQLIIFIFIQIITKFIIYYLIFTLGYNRNLKWTKSFLLNISDQSSIIKFLILGPYNLILNMIYLLTLYLFIKGDGIINEVSFDDIENINDIYSEL